MEHVWGISSRPKNDITTMTHESTDTSCSMVMVYEQWAVGWRRTTANRAEAVLLSKPRQIVGNGHPEFAQVMSLPPFHFFPCFFGTNLGQSQYQVYRLLLANLRRHFEVAPKPYCNTLISRDVPTIYPPAYLTCGTWVVLLPLARTFLKNNNNDTEEGDRQANDLCAAHRINGWVISPDYYVYA